MAPQTKQPPLPALWKSPRDRAMQEACRKFSGPELDDAAFRKNYAEQFAFPSDVVPNGAYLGPVHNADQWGGYTSIQVPHPKHKRDLVLFNDGKPIRSLGTVRWLCLDPA